MFSTDPPLSDLVMQEIEPVYSLAGYHSTTSTVSILQTVILLFVHVLLSYYDVDQIMMYDTYIYFFQTGTRTLQEREKTRQVEK